MSKLICIATYTNRMHAQVAANVLEEHGIKSMISADDAGGMHLELDFTSGGVKLMVLDEQLELARESLQKWIRNPAVRKRGTDALRVKMGE